MVGGGGGGGRVLFHDDDDAVLIMRVGLGHHPGAKGNGPLAAGVLGYHDGVGRRYTRVI